MIEKITLTADGYGLKLLGIADFLPEEITQYSLSGKAIALLGNEGSSYWPVFSTSAEYRDDKPHPLDRWSQRIAAEMTGVLKYTALFPFTGPPYYPFQRWAQRSQSLHQSPLGLLIHPRTGLWHSFRFGLILPTSVQQAAAVSISPCVTCNTQPCLHSCPVDAFSTQGYKVEQCRQFLRQNLDATCHISGCQARHACPVGENYRYDDAQSRLHLRAFIDAEN